MYHRMTNRKTKRTSISMLLLAALILAAVGGVAPVAEAQPNPDSSALREAVTVENVFGHMEALDDIATAN